MEKPQAGTSQGLQPHGPRRHPEALSCPSEAVGSASHARASQSLSSAGSTLISLLLKQPLTPGSPLGLCHLLSSCPEAPTGTLLQPLGFGR